MMNLDKLLEELNVCAENGVELDADERKARDILGLFRRVESGGNARRERIAEVERQLQATQERQKQSARRTFPGTRRADDDLVVVGAVRLEKSFRILHRADGSVEHCDGSARIQIGPNAWRDISDGTTYEGNTPIVYSFREGRSVHYVPREIFDVIPERVRDGIGFRDSVPRDLWKYVGGVENFLPLNRTINRSRGSDGRDGQATPEERLAAAAAAIAKCKELASGCDDADVLATWLHHTDSAGDAAPVLRALLESRMQELEGTARPKPSKDEPAPRAARGQIPMLPEPPPPEAA